jgi:hypothetical protein
MMDVHPLDSTAASATTANDDKQTAMAPPSLSSMSIRSTDTLTGQIVDSRVPETWNEQPPLLQQRKGVEETTTLLKGVRYIMLVLRMAALGLSENNNYC